MEHLGGAGRVGAGRLAGASALGAAVAAVGVLTPWASTHVLARGRVFTRLDDVPPRDVALVLGAQVYADGRPSRYLRGRLDAAAALYRAGRVRAILVSGDNGEAHYDEPAVMRDHLLAAGIPQGRIVCDPAGFDTYDSCVRARRVYGVRSVVVVSQTFHLPRALAICRLTGLPDAVGYGDTRPEGDRVWRRGQVREVLAGVKMAWDLGSRRTPRLGPVDTGVQDALHLDR